MREVRVHLYHELVTVRQGAGERRQVRATQAFLSRAMEYRDALFTCGDLVCETSCPVRRIVVDDQHVDVGRRPEDTVRDGDEVVAFVICRQHDENATAGSRGAHESRREDTAARRTACAVRSIMSHAERTGAFCPPEAGRLAARV